MCHLFSGEMATIHEVKTAGRRCFQELVADKRSSVVFVHLGLGSLAPAGGAGGPAREFLHHVGALAPFHPSAGTFFRAVAGSRLRQQLQQHGDQMAEQMQALDFSLVRSSQVLMYKEVYECSDPQQTISEFLQFLSGLKGRSGKVCFILKDEKQVKYFNKFFVSNFPKFDSLLRGVMCASLDSILKCVKSSYKVEDLSTLQVNEGKKETLVKLLNAKSDLMCIALFESFCIVLYNDKSLQILLKEVLGMKVDAKAESLKEEDEERRRWVQNVQEVEDRVFQVLDSNAEMKNEDLQDDVKMNVIVEAASTADNNQTELNNTEALLEDSYKLSTSVLESVKAEGAEKGFSDNLGNVKTEIGKDEDIGIASSYEMDHISALPTTLEERVENDSDLVDHFNPDKALTLFIKTVYYENGKTWKTEKNKATKSQVYSNNLLYLESYIHPSKEVFRIAIKPPNVLRGNNINNEHFYEIRKSIAVRGKKADDSIHYVGQDGIATQCHSVKTSFDMLATFVRSARKKHPSKQFNVFIREFETFNKLMKISEFQGLVRTLDMIVTLYSRATSSLARVPDLPLDQMTSYLNNFLSQDETCVLHKELVTNVFSGMNL